MLTHLTLEVQMLTQVLSVLHINRWVELPGTSQGVILQRLSGAKLYYRYADTRPHDDEYLGFLEGGGIEPISLIGGRIWVRSAGVTQLAWQAAIIAPSTPGALIGNLDNYLGNTHVNVVSILNELLQLQTSNTASPVVLDIVLTATDITNAYIDLPYPPIADTFRLNVYGGIQQRRNVDYTVTDTRLSWSTLALELLIDEGSVLSVSYFRG